MNQDVAAYYHSSDLSGRIFRALADAGKNTRSLELKDLAAIDQLHTGGFRATLKLAQSAGIEPGIRILDAGCGIGGSSRLLAKEFNSSVTGIDITDAFVQTARMLTKCCGLDDRVEFECGSILDIPFPEASFDAVLCQHILMNIDDKARALAQLHRVLKPGGQLLVHDVFKTGTKEIAYPVPWADHGGISFLEPWDIIRDLLEKTGFVISFVSDDPAPALAWWQKVKSVHGSRTGTPSPLGPHLVFGNNSSLFGKNMTFNLENDLIQVVEAVFHKT